MKKHHDEYLRLYPDCGKPKNHYTCHSVDAMRKHKVNLSCFAGERLHITTKRIASAAFNNMTDTITDRLLSNWLSRLSPTSCEPIKIDSAERLANERHLDSLRDAGLDLRVYDYHAVRAAPPSERMAMPSIWAGVRLKTARGTYCRNDLLVFRSRESDRLCAGFVNWFYRVWLGSPSQFLILLTTLVPMAQPGHWRRAGGEHETILAQTVLDAVPWYEPEEGVVAIVHFEHRVWD